MRPLGRTRHRNTHEDSNTDEGYSTKSSRGYKDSKASARTRAKSKPTEPSRENNACDGGADAVDARSSTAAPAAVSDDTVAPNIATSRHDLQARAMLVFNNLTPGEAAKAAATVHPDVSRIGKDVQDHMSVATPNALQALGKFKAPRISAVLNELKRMTLEEQ